MKTVILDTNFLVDCLSWKVDFFSELTRVLSSQFTLVVIDKTVDELDTVIKEGKQTERIGARLAKQLIAKGRVSIIQTDKKGHTDALILKHATKDTIVATQDQALKRKLKEKSIPVIVIRQKKYLELIGR